MFLNYIIFIYNELSVINYKIKDYISFKIHDLRSTSSCISEQSSISDDGERFSDDGAYDEVDFTEEISADRTKGLADESSKNVKLNEQETDGEDLEKSDRQNPEIDQTNDSNEIATVARLAADGAEK